VLHVAIIVVMAMVMGHVMVVMIVIIAIQRRLWPWLTEAGAILDAITYRAPDHITPRYGTRRHTYYSDERRTTPLMIFEYVMYDI
jgi:polyferredoxin